MVAFAILEISMSFRVDRDVAGLGPGPVFSDTLYRESGAVRTGGSISTSIVPMSTKH